ncbi:MAG: glycosyltransferase [Bacteroidota bacterium]
MNTSVKKNILICPLDWGLGHATRCVPIIREFMEKGANVILAASNRPLAFLKKEFPDLAFIDFPGYNIRYPRNSSMAFSMLRSALRITKAIRGERKLLDKIIRENKIDIVVSDNRFGLYNKKAYCIYMTHQVMIKCPPSLTFLEYFLYRKHRSYITKYNECWIPDFEEGMSLSGILSHKYAAHKNTFFVGPLSRFSPITNEEKKTDKICDVMVILSGPEPQRTIFEAIVINQALSIKKLKLLIVRGITEDECESRYTENVRMISHLETVAMRKAIIESELVICRPGYSSIMDLALLNKKAVFVPTPGQTEQEYLAKFYYQRNLFFYMKQKKFHLEECIIKSDFYQGMSIKTNLSQLSERINFLLER